jgi:LemA protein
MGKWIGLGVVLLLVLTLGMCGVGSYNGLVGSSQAVDAQWAQVENVYQRRADLIPNLVNTVKGAANFEQQTLTQIAEARASVGKVQIDAKNLPNNPGAFAQFEQAQSGLSSALSRLMVVVERYPELKANANFRDLQAQLEGTENRITVERMRYNETAQKYNTQRLRFPTMIFANMMGFGEKAYFKSQAGAERAPTVDFGNAPSAPAPAPSPAQ